MTCDFESFNNKIAHIKRKDFYEIFGFEKV